MRSIEVGSLPISLLLMDPYPALHGPQKGNIKSESPVALTMGDIAAPSQHTGYYRSQLNPTNDWLKSSTKPNCDLVLKEGQS